MRVRNTPQDVHNEILAWQRSFGTKEHWQNVIDVVKEHRDRNLEQLAKLSNVYQAVDQLVKEETDVACNRKGNCCIDDVPGPYIEFLFFMSPFTREGGAEALNLLYQRPPVVKLHEQESDGVYQVPPCTFLSSKDGVDSLCLQYERRPLACRSMVPDLDCQCESSQRSNVYRGLVLQLNQNLDAPDQFKQEILPITRGWNMFIQNFT
jgi:Fe-S-cluster containining protein